MHTHMIKYNQKGVEEALNSLKTGWASAIKLYVCVVVWKNSLKRYYGGTIYMVFQDASKKTMVLP